jgi:hypothetical protein
LRRLVPGQWMSWWPMPILPTFQSLFRQPTESLRGTFEGTAGPLLRHADEVVSGLQLQHLAALFFVCAGQSARRAVSAFGNVFPQRFRLLAPRPRSFCLKMAFENDAGGDGCTTD